MWSTISIGTLGDAAVILGSPSLGLEVDADRKEGLMVGIFDPVSWHEQAVCESSMCCTANNHTDRTTQGHELI